MPLNMIVLGIALSSCFWHAADAVKYQGRLVEPPGTSITPTAAVPAGHHAAGPAPTVGPTRQNVEVELAKRASDVDVCGYVSGDSASSFDCGYSSRCVTDGDLSAVFCCANTISLNSCVARTVCLNRAQYLSYGTNTNSIGLATGWCTSTKFPYCNVYVYVDAPISGYTFYQCGPSYTREVAYQSVLSSPSPTTSSSSSTTMSTTSSLSSSTTTSPGPGPNAGAIAGGVVGGLVVLALLIFGLFFLLRRRRVPEASQQAAPYVSQAPSSQPIPLQQGPGSPPLPGYSQQPVAAGPLYNRASMVKSPLETISPANSPPTVSGSASPMQFQDASPGGQSPQFQQAAVSPPAGANQWTYSPQSPAQQTQMATELPSTGGDHQLRELP